LFVKTVQFSRLEGDVQVLWDLETLGITESDRVYEECVDNVTFNKNRYSVKLSWKEGRDDLDSSCELSLSDVKGQPRKLRKETKVLKEYDSVIEEQLASGVTQSGRITKGGYSSF